VLVLVNVLELLAVQQLFGSEPVVEVLLEHGGHQLEGSLGVAHKHLVELEGGVDDLGADVLLVQRVGLGLQIGDALGHHLLEQHPAAPDVLGLVLGAHPREHLGAHLDLGALEDGAGVLSLGGEQVRTESEVDDLDVVGVLVDEDVLGLDVAVHHRALVDVVEAQQQLACNLLEDHFVDAHLVLLDEREHVDRRELGLHDLAAGLGDLLLDEPNYLRTVQLDQDIQFFRKIFFRLIGTKNVTRNNFYYILVCFFYPEQLASLHHGGCTSAHYLHDFIFV